MKRETLATVAIAVCCLFAIASAATGLEAAVETEPDEVINVESISLPIGTDTAMELREDIEGERTTDDTTDASDDDDPGDHEETDPSEESGPEEGLDDADRDEGASERDGDDDRDGDGERDGDESEWDDGDGQDDGSSTFGYGSGGTPDGLWGFLWSLLDAVLALLPFLVLLAAIATAVTYRERLLALIDHGGENRTEHERSTDGPVPRPAPSNDVERAWFALVRPFGDDETKTPREYATDAVASGADPDAVSRLTANFEAVRYGDEPVTGDRSNRAWNDLNRALGRDGETQ